VSEIVRSETVLEDVSRDTGIRVSELRASISTKELVATGAPRAGVTPLIEIGVKGDDGPRKIEDAADGLAQRVVDDVSGYVQRKVEELEEQVGVSESQLQAVEGRIQAAQRQQTTIIEDQSIPLAERLLLSANLNATITTADARRTALQERLFDSRQLMILAEQVEKSRVVEPAAAVKTTARSSRTSLFVGALIGLLVGAVAALVAEPVLARRRRS
jgi:gas vesicle protein